MNIFIIDPYYAKSHQYWAEFLQNRLDQDVQIFKGEAIHWKWQMEAGAIEMANQVMNAEKKPDVFLVTDYLNLPLFQSLLPQSYGGCAYIMYMHENQLSYPRSTRDTDHKNHRDNHYGWINYTSCLVADRILFLSLIHI